jgi:copper(I)-binding protein
MAKRFWAIAFFGMMAFAGCSSKSTPPEISIEEVWSRPVMLTTSSRSDSAADSTAVMSHSGVNGVVYLTVLNAGGISDRLLRAQTEVCEYTELHQTIMSGDRMSMQKVDYGIEVPARGELKLAPRGSHLMLMNLKHPLSAGDRFEVRLEFEKSGSRVVFSEVRNP